MDPLRGESTWPWASCRMIDWSNDDIGGRSSPTEGDEGAELAPIDKDRVRPRAAGESRIGVTGSPGVTLRGATG